MQPKFCSRCGNALKERDNFCRKCGAPVMSPSANAANQAQQNKSKINIPSYDEIKNRFNKSKADDRLIPEDNHEGTVLIGGKGRGRIDPSVKRGTLHLTMEEILRGCTKVIDFGTGIRYEVEIPAGLSPGNTIIVKDTGITDRDTGIVCDIELVLAIG